jgi:hypothetical protein
MHQRYHSYLIILRKNILPERKEAPLNDYEKPVLQRACDNIYPTLNHLIKILNLMTLPPWDISATKTSEDQIAVCIAAYTVLDLSAIQKYKITL